MKNMKKWKKLFAMMLVIVMAILTAIPAFADNTSEAATSKLTIKTTAGHTYKIYQLLKGDVSSLNNGSGILSNVTAGANLKSGTKVEAFITAITGKTEAELGNIAFSYAEGVSKYTVNGSGGDERIDVENGYYVIADSYTGSSVTDGSDTISRYMVAVVGDTIIEPKTTTPSIDKKIIDTDANEAIDPDNNKTDTAAIGDTIEYEITGKVPNTEGYKYYYYVVHDTLSKGLTLDQDSFAVTIGGKTLNRGTEYYVYITSNEDGTTTFELALEDLKSLVDDKDNGITVDSGISIKYNASVNDNAVIGKDPNTNTARLEYSNNPGSSERNDEEDKPGKPKPGTATGKGPDKTTKTYVTELTILKVDNNGKKLEGAEFTLSGENLNKVIVETATSFRKANDGEIADYYKLINGTYTKTPPSSAQEGEEGYNRDQYENLGKLEYVRVTTITASTSATGDPKKIVGTVNTEGYVTFTGLNAGTYTLTETKAPNGYNKIDSITFTISAEQENSSAATGGNIIWKSDSDKIKLDTANGIFDTTIENMPGSLLPSTGGMGTTIFYVLGSVLVISAAILLVVRRRMNAESQ